ncbi:hypothetical protein [Pseudoglutamicibacter albus]|uniref:hypothetical protein n=1 Tax=Pseudoglutamicibacter albus TaxID=98671 RepID=UPI003620DB3D
MNAKLGSDETPEDGTPQEEPTQEEAAQEETSQEETPEDEPTQEESTQDQPAEDEAAQDETPQEDASQEETPQDETIRDESAQEETAHQEQDPAAASTASVPEPSTEPSTEPSDESSAASSVSDSASVSTTAPAATSTATASASTASASAASAPGSASASNPPSEKAGGHKRKRRGLVAGSIVGGVLLLAAGAYAGTAWFTSDKLPAHITVSGVDISGLSSQEAAVKLEKELGGSLTKKLTLTAGSATASVTPLRPVSESTLRRHLQICLGGRGTRRSFSNVYPEPKSSRSSRPSMKKPSRPAQRRSLMHSLMTRSKEN